VIALFLTLLLVLPARGWAQLPPYPAVPAEQPATGVRPDARFPADARPDARFPADVRPDARFPADVRRDEPFPADVPLDTQFPSDVPPAFEPPPPTIPLTPLEREIANSARSAFARTILGNLYASTYGQHLWTSQVAARELVTAVRDSERHGLHPKDYGFDEIARLAESPTTSDRRDVALSRAFVRLAFDLRFGRVPVGQFTAAQADTMKLADGDNAVELAAAIESGQVREFLDRMEPPFALYKRLGDALERYRTLARDGDWKALDAGSPLRPGVRDSRVPNLRARLAASRYLSGASDTSSDLYDGDVVEAVKEFQARHGLERDGVAGRATVEALNVPATRRVDQIRATMERTRQFLRDLPARFVVVNTAAYSAYLIDGGQPVWSARIIVGKKELETPVFRTNIEGFILNPEWNVPKSIVQNELLPGLKRDPRKLEKMRIRRIGERYVQSSGPHNSLGRIKFIMPNDHAVYLHDTPTKGLFERRERAFSHGCVRLENPLQLAALLLDDPARNEATLAKEVQAGKMKTVRLRETVPVLVMTWSVVVSGDGRVDFLTDLYGQDDQVLAKLDNKPMPPKAPVRKAAASPRPPAKPAATRSPTPPAVPAASTSVFPPAPPPTVPAGIPSANPAARVFPPIDPPSVPADVPSAIPASDR
jgi:L,D-transpeptidase YcbB